MAAEITNIFHAVGMLRGDLATPAFLGNIGFLAAVTRVSPGVYTVTTEIPIDFGEALCFANTPSPGRASAQVTADGSIEVRCTVDGVPTDLSQVALVVLRYRLGEVLIPPDPPFPSGSGLATALVGYGAGVTVEDFYVRTPANGGDDTNEGTAAAPFATLQRALEEVERTQGGAVIHVGSGTYQAPIFRNLYGPVVLFGDGGGDGADDGLTELQGSTAAGAGTGAALIDGAFGAGAFDGKCVEMLDGAAAGYRRTITQTLVGGLVPLKEYVDAVPAPGDNFRVVEPAVIIDGLNLGVPLIQKCGAVDAQVLDGINPISAVGAVNQVAEGVYFCNIMVDGGVGAGQVTVVDSQLHLYGVEGFDSFTLSCNNSMLCVGSDDTANAHANNLATLLGIGRDQFAGYGAFLDSPPNGLAYRMARSTFVGFIQQPEQLYLGLGGSLATIMGGRVRQVLGQDTAHIFVTLNDAPIMNIGEGGTPLGVHAVAGAQIDLQNDGIVIDATTDGIRVQQGGIVWSNGGLSATGTTNAANASQGGTLYLRGDPATGTWAGAAAFRVSATETAVVAAFAALDGTLAAAVLNGSVVTRVF